uniref:Nuclease SbcCD subunit D n=1 Tax=uncultured bacterium contig00021 TaxID=1181511 RepID=A0A806KL40_9BACT|nr:exonuclease SbcD [uncultured bacterium contig00021]
MNGFPMLEEQKHAFRQIMGYIRTEAPAAVIIAGDVYDRAVPGVEAVQVFDDFLTALAGGGVTVMLVSGNHDSPERISFASRLLAEKRLFFYGAFDGAIHKVPVTDEFGEVNFWLLPFIKPSDVRGKLGEEKIESHHDAVAAVLKTAKIDYSARNVLVSHQFYTRAGVTPIRSESELNSLGGLDAVDAGLIERFDYTALGHLHGGQGVGSKHIRYCGSPVKYSFSELQQQKSVTVVEIREKGNLTVNTLPLKPIHDMREIKGRLETLTGGKFSSPSDKEDYLRVILTDEEEIIDPIGKLRSVYPNIMSLCFENSRTSIDISAITADTEVMKKLSPYELFSEFFLKIQGGTMSEGQVEIVRELLSGGELSDTEDQ